MTAKNILKQAEDYCAENSLRFTEPRRHVLKIIAGGKKPVGAYDVLNKLGHYIKNPKPPTAYRALEFLQEHGFIHRIESLNAYVACHETHHHSGSQFMVCDSCGRVIETHLCDLPDSLSKKAQKEGFKLSFWNLELHGTCKSCRG